MEKEIDYKIDRNRILLILYTYTMFFTFLKIKRKITLDIIKRKPKSKLGLQIFMETILQIFILSNLQKQV
jgi:hypothetical protein